MNFPTLPKLDSWLGRRMEGPIDHLNGWWIRANERFLNIDTMRDPPVEGVDEKIATSEEYYHDTKHTDGTAYSAPGYRYIYKALRILRPSPDDVFYDIGCGKGRIVCAFGRRGMKKVVGVELSRSLADAAIQNAERMRRRRAPIEILCEDAATADLSEGSIFYLNNPFGPDTLRDVLGNIRHSLSTLPRRIRIAYHASVHEDVFESCRWLENYHSFSTFNGARVTFWRNTDETNGEDESRFAAHPVTNRSVRGA